MRWFGAIFGTLLLALGVFTSRFALRVNAAFGADPACTTSITIATRARSGPTCVVYHGSISRTYSTYGSKGARQHHIVVLSEDGVVLDVEPEFEFWSPVFNRAKHGSPAVVETVKGRPAFIATSTGSLSAIGNPRTTLIATFGIAAVGALLIFLAMRKRRRRPPSRPPGRRP